MANYNQLFKRLEALGEASSPIRDYTISLTNRDELSPGRRIFKTPDEALKDIYEDAHKHGSEKIYVLIWYFYEDKIRDFDGYTWRPGLSSLLHPEGLEESDKSWLRIFGDSWINRHDPIAYPDPKPELEVFDIASTRELEWCLSYGYPSIEEWERCEIEDLNKNEPGRYSVKDKAMYQLIQQYRKAGYQVDYLHEPKNPVELLTDSYGRHKKEREGRV